MSRTGILTPYRCCPRHGQALESVLTENRGDELSWWCEECRGEWWETYFTMKEEALLPLKAMSRRFLLNCPDCGSGRCYPSCGCCFQHNCLDCGTQFYFESHCLNRPTLPEEEVAKLAATIWLDEDSFVAALPEPELELFPQVVTERCCDSHPEMPVIFAVDHATLDERRRFGWFCREVQCGFRSDYFLRVECSRSFFSLTDGPKFHCFTCNHVEFDQSEDPLQPLCVTCGARYQLSFPTGSKERSPRGPRKSE